MRYLQFVCTDPEAEPYKAELDNIEEWARLTRGNVLDGERLRPAEEAVTVRLRGGQVLVTDGPFAESKEWIAGFDLLDCPNLDTAIEVASKHPMARFGRIELRPYESDPPDVPSVAGPLPQEDRAQLFFQFLCTDPGAEPYRPEEDTIQTWVADMVSRGILLQGQVLRPVEDATLVRIRGDRLLVTDGPFAETKEWVNGFGILACRDRNEAIEVSSRHPAARFGRIELRAFWPLEG